ncbi:MAG TPA: ABC transporter permease [Pirellulales bacterium]|jgi:ribose transport system permease protein
MSDLPKNLVLENLAAEAPAPALGQSRWKRRATAIAGALGPLLALGLVIAVFALADWKLSTPQRPAVFLSANNIRNIAATASTFAVAALGMTVIIIAGGIDLSAGNAIALAATVLAWSLEHGYSAPVAVLAGGLTGCLAGAINGVLISSLRVVPFIITLGTMTIYLGIAKLLANNTNIRPPMGSVPHWLDRLVYPQPETPWIIESLGVPNFALGVWIAVGLAIVLAAVLRQTVFGRYVFALGSNELTARLCGVNVPWMKIAVYTLGGVFVGIAGVYQFSRLSGGTPTAGIGMELKVIAAVVIGGGSLNGGRGSVLGTMAGAVMMAAIASGCTILELSNPFQDILIGLIIITAVTVDQLRQWRQRR